MKGEKRNRIRELGFKWKGALWPAKEFYLDYTIQGGQIPVMKQGDTRLTQTINYDWVPKN